MAILQFEHQQYRDEPSAGAHAVRMHPPSAVSRTKHPPERAAGCGRLARNDGGKIAAASEAQDYDENHLPYVRKRTERRSSEQYDADKRAKEAWFDAVAAWRRCALCR